MMHIFMSSYLLKSNYVARHLHRVGHTTTTLTPISREPLSRGSRFTDHQSSLARGDLPYAPGIFFDLDLWQIAAMVLCWMDMVWRMPW